MLEPYAYRHAKASSASSSSSESYKMTSNKPVIGNYAGGDFVVGAGVAIFHLASSRVVLCYHSRDMYWFLPKGRRDINESLEGGACREGFEESGYRNRLLPLPLRTAQPPSHQSHNGERPAYRTEPVWMQLAPVTSSRQYVLYWFIAETLPSDIEEELNRREGEDDKKLYLYPPQYPEDLKLKTRMELEPEGWEPPRHPNTGVDEEEACYESHLLAVDQAIVKLGGTGVQVDVLKKGWEAIQTRLSWEQQEEDRERNSFQ